MPLTTIAICALLLAAALAFLRPPCFAAERTPRRATRPRVTPPHKPAWPHHRRHYWAACVRRWFGQPEKV